MTDTSTPSTEQRSIWSRALRAALFIVPAAVLLKVYWSTLVFLVSRWERQEEYSYCFLIPPVVAYLIWRLRRPLADVVAKPSWRGAWPLAAGVFLFWLGTSIGNHFLLEISLWLVAVGMLWLGFGWPRIKVMAFPLLFCLTMFPPPRFLVEVITQKLKLFSSQLGVFLIQSVGMPAYREGNIIDLGFTQLKVVEACSGLNSVISLGVLGILIAYFYRAVLWKKVLLVVSTLPLAIVANSLRIALTGLIAKYLGTEYAQGFFHDFSGWLMFILELPVLYLEMRILDKLPGSLRSDSPSAAQSSGQTNAMMSESHDRLRQSDSTVGRRNFSAALRLGAAVAVLLAISVLSDAAVENKVALRKPFTHFPDRIADWTGRRDELTHGVANFLRLTDYVLVDYHDPYQKVINFYVAFFDSQLKGEWFHSPARCYPGNGWRFEKVQKVVLPPAGSSGEQVNVNSVLMVKDGQQQVMYYWYALRGRVVTNSFWVEWYNFLDLIRMNRTDCALVRLVTPIGPMEKLADAQQRLNGFAGRLLPLLDQFIPN